jgi:hypothetical protein
MLTWYALLITLFLFPLVLPLSHAEFAEKSLTITVLTGDIAKVIEKINPRTTISSINIQPISNKISNILATDEKNTVLGTAQKGNMIKIDTLGASRLTLTYNANVLDKTSGIWNLNYNGTIESTIILPPLSDIVSVNNIPNDIHNDTVVMPAGQVSLSYTIRTVSANNFVASWNSINYPVQIITASKVEKFSFDQKSKTLVLTLDNNAPILAIIPKSLIGGPFGVQLNDAPMEFKQYYQNATDSWLKIAPTSSGSLKIIGSTVVPEFFSLPVLIFAIAIVVTVLITKASIKYSRI